MLINILISSVLALIMFGIGSSLSFDNILTTVKNVKIFSTGIFMQIFFFPLFTFIVVSFFDIPAEWKVGLLILSICPGGVTSNFITHLVNGNTSLSVALTAVSSLTALVLMPILIDLFLGYFTKISHIQEFSVSILYMKVFIVIIIPVILGLICNKYFPVFVNKIAKILKLINITLLALVFTIKFFADSKNGGSGMTYNDILNLLPYCLSIHLGAVFCSYWISKYIIRLNNTDASTIGIAVGIQNSALALFFTDSVIQNTEMSNPPLLFAMFSFFTTLLFALATNFKGKFSL